MGEATSARVARMLMEKEFNAYVINGGLKACKRAGLPMEQVPETDVELLPKFD